MTDSLKFDKATNTLTVSPESPATFVANGRVISGEVKLTKTTTVVARPPVGRPFKKGTQTEWTFEVASEEDVSTEKPTDEPVAETAGTTPENPAQQAAKANSSLGTNQFRLP